jgi:hypothetical protein
MKRNIAPRPHAGGWIGTARLGNCERLLGIAKKAERDLFAKLYARPSYYLTTDKRDAGTHGMDKSVEENIRNLAQPLWESAARPYGMAMDFWLMAEQMVLEMMAATARMQKATSAPPPPSGGDLPSAVPVGKVRELAECMWESAGRQYGMAQDYWLSAERHVLAMMRAATTLPMPGSLSSKAWTAELLDSSPSAYLERIRTMAYQYWEAAGRGYGRALDYWLQAERNMLSMMAAEAERNARSAAGNDDSSTAQPVAGSEEPGVGAVGGDPARSPTSVSESGPA